MFIINFRLKTIVTTPLVDNTTRNSSKVWQKKTQENCKFTRINKRR